MQNISCRGQILVHLCNSYLDETSHGKMQGWPLGWESGVGCQKLEHIRNKGERRDLCCESCSEVNMFEKKAISPTTAFLFKNSCMLLHEFNHPLQRCIFFHRAIIRTEWWESWSTRALGVRVRKNARVHSGVSQRGGLKRRRRWVKSCCVYADTACT